MDKAGSQTRSLMRGVIAAGLLVATLLLTGCASAIHGTGKYRKLLRDGVDRQTIVQELGEPVDRGIDKFGDSYEVFRAKGKIAPDQEEVDAIMMGEVLSFGVGSAIWVPIELVRWPFLAVGEKEIHIMFDEHGKYLRHTVRRPKKRR